MNVLMLAAGYGTRLQRDVLNSSSHSHLLNIPKALLPLNGKPLVDYWIECVPDPTRFYIVCNDYFYLQFEEWATTTKGSKSQILNDGTRDNDSRLGSVGDLCYAINHFHLYENDLLVIAGDTLFLRDFNLNSSFLSHVSPDYILITCYTLTDDQVSKSGIVELDENGFLIKFLEKPNPTDTTSRLGSPCFYHIPKIALHFVSDYMTEMKENHVPLSQMDASGTWIAWMVGKYPIKAVPISGRLDIGGLSSFIEAETYLKNISA